MRSKPALGAADTAAACPFHLPTSHPTPAATGLPPLGNRRSPLRVMELFAGIGGFRLGLERASRHLSESGYPGFEVVYANQYEPASTRQWAAAVNEARFDAALDNRDITEALDDPDTVESLVEAAPDVLVAGFPCQDYSVANSRAAGLKGDKGALWWQIVRVLQQLKEFGKPVYYLLLENVPQLLTSPRAHRGQDFAQILQSLGELGYAVAWRVVNASDYGFAQRRKRVYLSAILQGSPAFASLKSALDGGASATARWLLEASPMVLTLPAVARTAMTAFEISETGISKQGFRNTGLFCDGKVLTLDTDAASLPDGGVWNPSGPRTLGKVIAETGTDVLERYFLRPEALKKWAYVKGAKRVQRVTAEGFAYEFSEGAVAFPEPLDRPSRTLLTSCAGQAVSRTALVVQHSDGRLRRLTPEELEALSDFPRGFTAVDGIPEGQRGFLVGNAVVTGVIALLGMGLVRQVQACQAQ